MGGFHRDPQFRSKAFQATDYGTGILCGRKHTMVVLRDERHAVRFEPLVGIPVTELFEQEGIRHIVKRTDIGSIVFDVRGETNPCSLCARMRRGALHDLAKAEGCNKIALGHHRDDAVETFIMNLFNEGRVGCFSPVTYLSRKDITMIRPLVLAEEKDIRQAVRRMNFPVIRSSCPVDGHTEREWTKQWLAEMEHQRRGIKQQIFGAMRRGHISGW